jgi:hypothetical protein
MSQGLKYLSKCGIALPECFYAAGDLYHMLECCVVEARNVIVPPLSLSIR